MNLIDFFQFQKSFVQQYIMLDQEYFNLHRFLLFAKYFNLY